MIVTASIGTSVLFGGSINQLSFTEDLSDNFIKQARNVVNAAISQLFHPVPSTFLLPKYNINIIPVIDIILYKGVIEEFHIFALIAAFSYDERLSSYAILLSSSLPYTL